jgi:hypothetical protein
MTLSILFWVLYLLCVVFGMWSGYAPGQPYSFKWGFGGLLIWVLVGILGWAVFGGLHK